MNNKLIHRTDPRRQRRRGFTLTEIAIVLGIIGLILGAIWVAASAVYNNLRVSKATTEMLQIAQAVRALYATQTSIGDLAGTDETAVFCKANVLPTDMVASPGVPGGCDGSTVDPWSGTVDITSQAIAATPGDEFMIEFNLVPAGACAQMLVSNTGTGRDAGLTVANASGATVSGNKPANLGFPVSVTAATGACGGATNSVQFAFKLKG